MCILFLFQSCASMFSGTDERIHLKSQQKGTKFYLNGTEFIGEGSTSVKISKKKLKDSSIVAKKKGCRDEVIHIDTKFDPTTLLGLLIDFGLISILVVDLGITGAVKEAERTNYVVDMNCK